MSQDPADARRSLAFDRARRQLILNAKTVGGESRKEWLERFTELLKAMFPDAETNVAKPGLATRMYSADVSIGSCDKIHALDLARELDDNWRVFAQEYGTVESCCYLDRLDGMWEWVVDLGDGTFVSGCARLKNSAFVSREDRPEGTGGGFQRGRGSYGDRGDRGDRKGSWGRPAPRRPYGDRDAEGGRRTYGDRPQGERRPYGDRPYGDRRPSYGDRDRPQGDRRRSFGDRPQGDRRRSFGDRPFGDRQQGDRGRSFGNRDRHGFKGNRKPFGDRPYQDRDDDTPPRGDGE